MLMLFLGGGGEQNNVKSTQKTKTTFFTEL